jgi:predicted aspartyl protease
MLKISIGFDDAPAGARVPLLTHHGASLRVHVGFDPTWKPTANFAPKPGDQDLSALVDTGARESCIDHDLAVKLRLPFFNRRHVSTPNAKVLTDFCRAQIHVPRLRFTQTGEFAAMPLVKSGFGTQVILGRSFLRYLRLEYDGTTGEVFLMYPPSQEQWKAS